MSKKAETLYYKTRNNSDVANIDAAQRELSKVAAELEQRVRAGRGCLDLRTLTQQEAAIYAVYEQLEKARRAAIKAREMMSAIVIA